MLLPEKGLSVPDPPVRDEPGCSPGDSAKLKNNGAKTQNSRMPFMFTSLFRLIW